MEMKKPYCNVTPYVGVWIETKNGFRYTIGRWSLLMWECGLKHVCTCDRRDVPWSLLMWECGLKLCERCLHDTEKASLLMWECGLKH